MAATKIADVIVPEVFNPYTVQRTTEISAFFNSGIVQTVPELGVFNQGGGTSVAMPFWKDLGGAAQILSDTIPLSVNKITSGQDVAVVHFRGNAWGVNDLAKALSGSDPMRVIGDEVAAWWARVFQAQILATLEGVFASGDLDANKSDISGNTGDASVASGATIVDAIYKLGDAAQKVAGYAMHSATVASLVKTGLIDYLRDADGNPYLPTFMGKPVVMDDGMPVTSGTYTTYIFGPGAIGYAPGFTPTPSEVDRDSLAGEDYLINRRHYVLHPRGVAWVGTAAGVGPTDTELRSGANWDLRWDRKNIRVVQFKHKLAA